MIEDSRKWVIGRTVHFYHRHQPDEPWAATIISDSLVKTNTKNFYQNNLRVIDPEGREHVFRNISESRFTVENCEYWWEEPYNIHPSIRAFPAT